MTVEELIAEIVMLRRQSSKAKNQRITDMARLNFYIRTNEMLKNRLEAWEKLSHKRTYKNIQTVKERGRKMKEDIRILRRENG